jgi:hypothetical protein
VHRRFVKKIKDGVEKGEGEATGRVRVGDNVLIDGVIDVALEGVGVDVLVADVTLLAVIDTVGEVRLLAVILMLGDVTLVRLTEIEGEVVLLAVATGLVELVLVMLLTALGDTLADALADALGDTLCGVALIISAITKNDTMMNNLLFAIDG